VIGKQFGSVIQKNPGRLILLEKDRHDFSLQYHIAAVLFDDLFELAGYEKRRTGRIVAPSDVVVDEHHRRENGGRLFNGRVAIRRGQFIEKVEDLRV